MVMCLQRVFFQRSVSLVFSTTASTLVILLALDRSPRQLQEAGQKIREQDRQTGLSWEHTAIKTAVLSRSGFVSWLGKSRRDCSLD